MKGASDRMYKGLSLSRTMKLSPNARLSASAQLYHRRREQKWYRFITIGTGILLFIVLNLFILLTIRVIRAADALETPTVVTKEKIPADELTIPVEEIIIQEETRRSSAGYLADIPLILIDAGHGGVDNGCREGEILEKDINLAISLKLKEKLQDMGYQVIMIREDDTYMVKEDRVEMAALYDVDIYLSIHQNYYEDRNVNGIETWYYGEDTSRDSERLARVIHQQTVGITLANDRDLKDDADFCVTNRTSMAACLIETGFLSNSSERELLLTPEYQEKLAAGIARGIEYYFNPKTMYLTFDDGPSAENTNAILDILKERDIQATFFVVGENVLKNPEVAKRIVAEGHIIGIHCYRHDYKVLYESAESYIQDFEEAYRIVYEVTGVEAKLYRFPGGSINAYNKGISEEIIERMDAEGFIYFDWNASLDDAIRKAEPEELVVSARETTLDRKKVVLLAHDIVYETVLCLESLLDEFPEYRMETLTDDVAPIQF